MGDANTDPPTKADDADTLDGKDSSTIQDHANLSNVTSGQHHTKTTSSDIDHANVTNVNSGQHHTRPSAGANLTEDANNNFDVVDASNGGTVDADTVDGSHASDLGAGTGTKAVGYHNNLR